MDKKIGEKFVYKGNIYKVVECGWCQNCDLKTYSADCSGLASQNKIPYCVSFCREDNKEVVFQYIGKAVIKDLD